MTSWTGCYDDSWKGFIVDEAFAHPAKMARGLLSRILVHLKMRYCLPDGSLICDPFGGIGTTAILGASKGYRVVCVELEPKFVDLAKRNFDMHRRTWQAFNDPNPVMLQGDSRRLREVLGTVLADACVGSPPFAEAQSGGGICKEGVKRSDGTIRGWGAQVGKRSYTPENQGESDGQLANMPPGSVEAVVGSPPYEGSSPEAHSSGIDLEKNYATYRASGGGCSFEKFVASRARHQEGYGNSEGQLGSLPEGSCDAVIGSPPYAESLRGDNSASETAAESHAKRSDPKQGGSLGQSQRHQGYGGPGNLGNLPAGEVEAVVSSPPYISGGHHTDQTGAWNTNGLGMNKGNTGMGSKEAAGYGGSPGQLAALPAGCVDGVVASPPWEKGTSGHDADFDARRRTEAIAAENGARQGGPSAKDYGDSEGQLGNSTGETFWSAALEIVRECHAILKLGGLCVWVVKSFVRDGQIVDFPGQWRRLCEACGFETLEEVHASLVKEESHPSLFGGEETKRTERKSFFRRLHERKRPDLSIDHETVYFMRK